ncbi:hypothetical protein ARMA_2485 [Ardenticatena maritima]|uniref:Uncharacterized protein n=1 Tax=Ardenticatena maritima TaxID=872965 RepID=A0A0M8KAH4_9CHLR|nr:hypothetical protein ARMA_2485 [Ardenticatena maritima]
MLPAHQRKETGRGKEIWQFDKYTNLNRMCPVFWRAPIV